MWRLWPRVACWRAGRLPVLSGRGAGGARTPQTDGLRDPTAVQGHAAPAVTADTARATMAYLLEHRCYRNVHDVFLRLVTTGEPRTPAHFVLCITALARADRAEAATRLFWSLVAVHGPPAEGGPLKEVVAAHCRLGSLDRAAGLLRRWAAAGHPLPAPAVDQLLHALFLAGNVPQAMGWLQQANGPLTRHRWTLAFLALGRQEGPPPSRPLLRAALTAPVTCDEDGMRRLVVAGGPAVALNAVLVAHAQAPWCFGTVTAAPVPPASLFRARAETSLSEAAGTPHRPTSHSSEPSAASPAPVVTPGALLTLLAALLDANDVPLAHRCLRLLAQVGGAGAEDLVRAHNDVAVRYCRRGQPFDAQAVVEEMVTRRLPVEAATRATLCAAFAVLGHLAEARATLLRWPCGLAPEGGAALHALVAALCDARDWESAEATLGLPGARDDDALGARVLAAYCAAGRRPEAEALLRRLRDRGGRPTLAAVTALLALFGKTSETPTAAVAALLRLLGDAVRPPDLFAAAIAAAVAHRQWADATLWGVAAVRGGVALRVPPLLQALDAAALAGDKEGVDAVVAHLRSRGPLPPEAYGPLLAFHAARGHWHQVRTTYVAAIGCGVRPSLQMYAPLCAALAVIGDPAELESVWEEAKAALREAPPRAVHKFLAETLRADPSGPAGDEALAAWLDRLVLETGYWLTPAAHRRILIDLSPAPPPPAARALRRLHDLAERHGLWMEKVWAVETEDDPLGHLRQWPDVLREEAAGLRAILRELALHPLVCAPLSDVRAATRWGDAFAALGPLDRFVVRHARHLTWSVAREAPGSVGAAVREATALLHTVRWDLGFDALRLVDVQKALEWEVKYAHLGGLVDVVERFPAILGRRHGYVALAGQWANNRGPEAAVGSLGSEDAEVVEEDTVSVAVPPGTETVETEAPVAAVALSAEDTGPTLDPLLGPPPKVDRGDANPPPLLPPSEPGHDEILRTWMVMTQRADHSAASKADLEALACKVIVILAERGAWEDFDEACREVRNLRLPHRKFRETYIESRPPRSHRSLQRTS